jgi:hypothetical protein
MTEPKTPKALDAFVDIVLAYKPKPKTKPGKKRKKRAAKIAKATSSERESAKRRSFES